MITVKTSIKASIDKVWEFWILPEHIINWNTLSEEWQTSNAENALKVGGKFKYSMIAKDKSQSFDFEGEYTNVEKNKVIDYKLFDGRTGIIHFQVKEGKVELMEIFEPVKEHSESMQKDWCQAVIDNFKHYVESF